MVKQRIVLQITIIYFPLQLEIKPGRIKIYYQNISSLLHCFTFKLLYFLSLLLFFLTANTPLLLQLKALALSNINLI